MQQRDSSLPSGVATHHWCAAEPTRLTITHTLTHDVALIGCICVHVQEMDQMREELRRMVEMFAAAGKIATTDWMTLPPPI